MDEERTQRVDALRALSSRRYADGSAQVVETTLSHERSYQNNGVRWLLAIVIVTVLTGLVAGGVALHEHQSSGRTVGNRSPLAETHNAGLACSSGAAWAPNGRYFAVLGSIGRCGMLQSSLSDPSQARQILAIFDGTTGNVVREIGLAKYLGSIPYGNCNVAAVSVCYNGLLWSPDSRSIAVTTTLPSSDPIRHHYQLLLVQADGNGAVTIPGALEPELDNAHPVSALWDVLARTVHYVPVPVQFTTAHHLTWLSDGTVGDSSAPPGSAPAPIGIESGGDELSPWQPGELNGGGQQAAFMSQYWAWSPDGRYVVVGLVTDAALPFPGTSMLPSAVAPYVSVMPRDQALVTVEQEIRAHISEGSETPLAWDPSGRYLAALRCTDADTGHLSIYETSAGTLVANSSIHIPIDGPSDCRSYIAGMSLSWSPISRMVLMVDRNAGGIMLWSPNLH